jgi:hypothetical protein
MTWKKGQSGNPNGRPRKNKALSEELRRLLQGQAPGKKETNLQVITAKLVTLAREGDKDAIRYIFDRLEGRPAQALEFSGDKARPLHITYGRGSDQGDKEA